MMTSGRHRQHSLFRRNGSIASSRIVRAAASAAFGISVLVTVLGVDVLDAARREFVVPRHDYASRCGHRRVATSRDERERESARGKSGRERGADVLHLRGVLCRRWLLHGRQQPAVGVHRYRSERHLVVDLGAGAIDEPGRVWTR